MAQGAIVVWGLVSYRPLMPSALDSWMARATLGTPGGTVARGAELVTKLGRPKVVVALGAALAVGAWLRWRDLAICVFCLAAPVIAGGLERALKEAGYSFPSGHATGTSAVATVALVVGCAAWTSRAARLMVSFCAVSFVAIVAGTRLVLGVHYLTDVIGGVALGCSVTLALAVAVDAAPTFRARTALPLGREKRDCR
jgi:membrane-associated phospholipid phosphatase